MSRILSNLVPDIRDLEVHFDYDDNDEKQYFLPGELMKGTILLHLSSPIQVKRINLHLTGTARVSWEIPEKKKSYTASETYLDTSQSLLDGVLGNTLRLGRGTHEFPFNHQLSPALPSTFKGVYGSVAYVMKVELEAEDPGHNTVTTEPFLVLRRPPLPKETFLPRDLKDSRRLFKCCSFGKVTLKAGLTRYGGVPGENIFINAQVTNWSDREIKRIIACVVMTSVYRARGKSITFRQMVSKREDEYEFNVAHGRRWRAIKLQIPPYIADTDLPGCSIMDVTYSFHFRVELDDCDLSIETPLQVGGHPMGYGPISDVTSVARLSHARDFPYYNGKSNGGSRMEDFSDFTGNGKDYFR